MARLQALVLDRDVPAVLAAVADLGEAELLPPESLPEWSDGALEAIAVGDLAARAGALARRAGDAAEALGVASAPGDTLELADPDTLGDAERFLADVESALRRIEEGRAAAEARTATLRSLVETLRALRGLPVDVASLRTLSFLALTPIRIGAANLPRLRQALEDRAVLVVPLGEVDRRLTVLLAHPRSSTPSVEATLTSLFAETLALPDGVSGVPTEALGQLEDELDALDVERRRLDLEVQALAVRHRRRLGALAHQLRATRVVADLEKLTARSGRVRLFSAWIPASAEESARRAVAEASGGSAVVRCEPAPVGEEARKAGLRVPTRLRNAALVRPFEAIVEMYGRPAYGEIDPTPVVALSFVTMFGMMFGDLGQGALLFLTGLFLRLRVPSLRPASVMVMLCSTSSMVFGVLYGDAFGWHFMHPLYLKPMADTMRFLLHAGIFGVAFMTIGLAMNLANAVRTRDWGDLLFGKGGLAGIVFYWGTLVCLVILGLKVSWYLVLGIWVIPMVLMFFKEPLTHALERRKKLIHGGVGEFLVGAFFELFETAIGYLSNTISFVRLAAFALNHAGLFTVVFLLAEMADGGAYDAWVNGLILVIGNLFIIGLEGLVVTIQSLRLEYYEFFSKFYRGTGTEFRPVRLDPVPAAAGRRGRTAEEEV